MNTTLAGRRGEALAAAYLRKKGYCILAAGYRSPYGEIDLIARKGELLCFVEVKTRSSAAVALPREAVDRRKQERLRSAAGFYLAEKGLDCPVRFDVAEVYLTAGAGPRIEYLENAF